MSNLDLLKKGESKISWTSANMSLLKEISNEFTKTQPFKGMTIGVSIHIEQKTAVLLRALKAGGAAVFATGNLGTTQNDIALALNESGVKVYGQREDSREEHIENVRKVLRHKPNILLDNGADLIHYVVNEDEFSTEGIIGGTEETTSGGIRMREEMPGRVPFPIIVINDSPLKMIVENKHGVGQSVVESFSRITNLMIIGRRITVIGYGWCGRGIAKYFRSFGALVTIVETDSIKALEAAVDGYSVIDIDEAVAQSSVIVTATGRPKVINEKHFENMKDGVVLANSGHFDWEIDTNALRTQAKSVENLINGIETYTLPNGKKVTLLCEGRMFNLGGIEPKGNTVETMDLGFTLQALSLQWVAQGAKGLHDGAQPVPDAINYKTADLMLESMK